MRFLLSNITFLSDTYPMKDQLRVLRKSLGRPFHTFEGLVYAAPGEMAFSLDNLIQLRITCDSGHVSFRCGSDGETLIIDGSNLCPANLGEFGELRKTDLSHLPEFTRCLGTPLRQILLVKDSNGQLPVGVVLEFAAELIVICNWGDELKIWDSIPESLFADEGLKLTSA